MITMHDLYDLYAIVLKMRHDIEHEDNLPILQELITTIGSLEDTTTNNAIRAGLRKRDFCDLERIFFIQHDNIYTYTKCFKSKGIFLLLLSLLYALYDLIKAENYKTAYDLCDKIHDLPVWIVESNGDIPKKFWKICIKTYRTTWDKNFLKEEETKIKKIMRIEKRRKHSGS